MIHLPGSRSHQSGHKSSRFASEKATKLDSKLDYKPLFGFSQPGGTPRKIWGAQQDLNLRLSDTGLKTGLFPDSPETTVKLHPLQTIYLQWVKWWAQRDLNPRPSDYESYRATISPNVCKGFITPA